MWYQGDQNINFWPVSPAFLGIFLVRKSGSWKLCGKSFHFQCESWSGRVLREDPTRAVESCNGIKMFKISTFLTNSPTFLVFFLVLKSGFWKLYGKSFRLQCESWSGVNWALCVGPMSAVESCNGIKMFKIAAFLTSSSTFLGKILVWKSGFWKLYGKSFHFQCESWSCTFGASR